MKMHKNESIFRPLLQKEFFVLRFCVFYLNFLDYTVYFEREMNEGIIIYASQ